MLTVRRKAFLEGPVEPWEEVEMVEHEESMESKLPFEDAQDDSREGGARVVLLEARRCWQL